MNNSTTNLNSRIEFVDRLRGISIILVIVGHIIQFNEIDGGSNNRLFGIIYSFHMPLFFILSGYVAAKGGSKVASLSSLGSFITKKIYTLILPLFSWTLISNKFFFSESINSLQIKDIISTILHPGLWFLQILFEIQVIFGLFSLLSNSTNRTKKLLLDIALFAFLFAIPALGYVLLDKSHFATVGLFTLFFFIGVFVSKYSILEKLLMNQHIYGISVLLFLSLTGLWAFNGNEVDDLLKIIISIAAFIVSLNLLKHVNIPPIIDSQIQLFGRESLAIYIMQFYLTERIIVSSGIIGNNLFVILLLLIIMSIPIAYISVLTHKIFEKSSFLDFVFFGKYK